MKSKYFTWDACKENPPLEDLIRAAREQSIFKFDVCEQFPIFVAAQNKKEALKKLLRQGFEEDYCNECMLEEIK